MEVIVELSSTYVRILVVEILFGTVFYWVGWPVCKAITFGRYPNSLASSNGKNRYAIVSLMGVTVSLGIFLWFIYSG
jgi:uncharacterized protein with PQ loop repeat